MEIRPCVKQAIELMELFSNFRGGTIRCPSWRKVGPWLEVGVEKLEVENQGFWRPNTLRICWAAHTLARSVNEPSPRSDSKLCPTCGAKIAFSLALHMMAAHSPEGKARTAETPEETLPYAQVPAHQQSRPRAGSRSKRPNHTRTGRSGFRGEQGKRRKRNGGGTQSSAGSNHFKSWNQ